ncbi:hypothetical protein BWI17_17025 [Betaproteobacteria bacterium GR16-43]|nr:hypothetical protein BWI17_17025 [Betaproteobacteria bacterium GR16-43]
MDRAIRPASMRSSTFGTLAIRNGFIHGQALPSSASLNCVAVMRCSSGEKVSATHACSPSKAVTTMPCIGKCTGS